MGIISQKAACTIEIKGIGVLDDETPLINHLARLCDIARIS